MSEHTKGPWEIYRTEDGRCYVMAGGKTLFLADSEANARRIVACVNACEGIPNEALENIGRTKAPSPLAAMLTLSYDNLSVIKENAILTTRIAELEAFAEKVAKAEQSVCYDTGEGLAESLTLRSVLRHCGDMAREALAGKE